MVHNNVHSLQMFLAEVIATAVRSIVYAVGMCVGLSIFYLICVSPSVNYLSSGSFNNNSVSLGNKNYLPTGVYSVHVVLWFSIHAHM